MSLKNVKHAPEDSWAFPFAEGIDHMRLKLHRVMREEVRLGFRQPVVARYWLMKMTEFVCVEREVSKNVVKKVRKEQIYD